MRNREPITAEQLVNKDQQQLDHYNDSLRCGRYKLEQREHKREKWDKIFKHQLFLIIDSKCR